MERDTQPKVLDGYVHRFIPGAKSSATLLLLHGTGGNEDDLIPLGRELGEGKFSLLSPRGNVLEGSMPRFFKRLSEGVFDLEDLKFRTEELANFVISSAKEYGFDQRRVIAIGYSNGANIAASMLLLRPKVLHGAILFRAMLPLVPEKPPNLDGKQVLLLAGNYDQIIPSQKVLELEQLLKKSGADVTMNWAPSDHSLAREEITLARGFLRNHHS